MPLDVVAGYCISDTLKAERIYDPVEQLRRIMPADGGQDAIPAKVGTLPCPSSIRCGRRERMSNLPGS